MYFFRFSLILTGLIVISVFNWQCAEEPIVADLSHLSQTADTLTLHSITGFTYQVPPEIGSIKRLYVGTKGELYFPFTFLTIHSYGSDGTGWDSLLDTAITIDSVFFKVYSNDSLLSSDIGVHLYFLPDSFFSELESNYIDYPSFSFSQWADLDRPSISQVIDTTDTAQTYAETVLSWEISEILPTLMDTTDSNLVRTFGIGFPENLDSTFLEIYSREYSSGSQDPKIEVYYRQEMYVASESSPIDTLMKTFYTVGDLSIVYPGEGYDVLPGEIAVSQGKGFRSIVNIPFDSLTLPEFSLIRSAKLILKQGSDTTDAFGIAMQPLSEGLDTTETIFDNDPYQELGAYSSSSTIVDGKFEISLKSFLQSILMVDTLKNVGMKLSSGLSSDLFETARFDLFSDTDPARVEILYVAP
ncbi:uncharacterized protein METZ01_LOCUS112392 [marine metagenome]|uniref:DUF4270 family protein n=1 Tax=marine metagenome TaxID=408172 RepID=A0A381X4H3_9ZZZZ